ncbi:hypothetical protein [Xanthomonas campestris]|uniref:hypothetical protein n=1 Tax=Xanthomonas campestris TaxID=339 RepID=UPI00129038A7|nr:hypothetical protein [Xanthomonas campestris]
MERQNEVTALVSSEAMQHAATSKQDAPLRRVLRQTFGVDLKWWVPCWGGGMVLAHFLRIGYVPSLSLGDLGVVLSAVALFGGIALLGFLALLGLPALMISLLVDQHLLPAPSGPKQVDANRKGLRSYYRRAQPELGRRKERVLERLIIFFVAALLAGIYDLCMLYLAKAGYEPFPAYGILIGLGGGLFSLVLLPMIRDASFVRWLWPLLRTRSGTALLMLLMYLAFWPIAGFAVDYFAPVVGARDWFYLSLSAFMVVFVHWTVYATHLVEMNKRIRVIVPAVLMVLAYSGGLLGTIDVSVRKLGIGMLPGVQLQLTEQGCQIVKASWGDARCERAQPESSVFVLPAVDVLTRLGSDFYVAAPGGLADEHEPRFLIPASQVLSWSRIEAVKKTDAAAAVAPAK